MIVRDQESKASVPEFLKNHLCLTVYEAKGLEFDEVILYNFFNDTKCGSQWKLLNEVFARQTIVKKASVAEFLDFEMLDCEEAKAPQPEEEEKKEAPSQTNNDDISTQRVEGDNEINTVLELKTEFSEVYRKFS